MNQSNRELAQELLDVINELASRPTPWNDIRDVILLLSDEEDRESLRELISWFVPEDTKIFID